MKLLVTRPEEDAERTAADLKACGHDAVIAPLLEIRFRDGPEPELDDVQAILVTSANGIRALSRRTARRDLAILAVGPQSAEAARLAGFTDIKSADGDAAALAEACRRWTKPEAGALFHAAGAQTKGGLAETLRADGFTVRAEILYEAVPTADLSPEVLDSLRQGDFDAVLLYSPRSARVFAGAIARAGLAGACSDLQALCISRATADALAGLAFKAVRVASRPDQASMLALLA